MLRQQGALFLSSLESSVQFLFVFCDDSNWKVHLEPVEIDRSYRKRDDLRHVLRLERIIRAYRSMEISSLSVLLIRISSFLYFSSCDNITSELVKKYYQEVKEILKLLKPILDQVTNREIASDGVLRQLFEGLSHLIDELREIFENWQPSSSKLHFVLLSESLISKIYKSNRDIFLRLESLHEHLPVEVGSTSLEQYVQKMKHMQHEQLSTIIKYALRYHLEGIGPNIKLLVKIAEILSLKTNKQILMEILALEKLKENAELSQTTGEAEFIGEMLALMTHMHERLILLKKSRSCSSVPMEDTTIISNYNIKAPISSLCKNNVRLIDSTKSENLNQSCQLRCMESDKHREFLFLQHSHEYQQTSLKSLSSVGSPLESLNVGDLNHLPAPLDLESSDFSHMPQNGTRLGFGRLSITSSEDFHNLNENNVDIISEQLVSPSRTDLPNVTFDKRSPIHNVVFSDSNANPNFTQSISGDTIDTPTVSIGLTAPAVVIPTVPLVEPGLLIRSSMERPQSNVIWTQPHEKFLPEIVSSSAIEPSSEVGGIKGRVHKLVDDLKSYSLETLRAAIAELRFLARHNTENRIVIAECGAISFLVNLLHSSDAIIQEHAVTTLLNLSIHDDYKIPIAQANAIEPLIHVLVTGSPEAKENSAAALFSLAMIDDNKVKIASSGAIGPLVELLGNGTLRGKKDAATALFYLSTLPENKVKIVQAGAVKLLVELMDPSVGMVDKAVAVLANLASVPEGRVSISREGGIPVLVEAVELCSARGKENAAAALLRLCSNSNKFCTMALQEGVIPPLVALSRSGTRRGKEKAKALLNCFINQGHSKVGKG